LIVSAKMHEKINLIVLFAATQKGFGFIFYDVIFVKIMILMAYL
jgi:hypothetical protein